MWKRDKSPLMIAIRCGHIDAVKLLIEHGANVNVRWSDAYGYDYTALWLVSGNKNPTMIDIVSVLLKNGADPNLVSGGFLYAPLHRAACADNLEVAILLICYGADVNIRTVHGETPIQIAIQHKSEQVLGYLMNIC